MKYETKYLVGTGQPGDRIVYYSDERTMAGEMIMSNVEEAKVFGSFNEVLDYLKIYSNDARFAIIRTANVTLDKIYRGYESLMGDRSDSEAEALYFKYNRLSYVMNSEKE